MQPLEEGQKFERYRIHRQLGSGLSGDSYEAEDIMLHRTVTLKLVHPWSPLPDAARRQFFREIQDISRLTHPSLATTLDYGEVDGQLYVARRFVSSGSLLGHEGRLWFRPPLRVADAIRCGYQLSQALQYIHNTGYLHGSLTFSNILVLRGIEPSNQKESAPFLLADVGLTHFVRRFGRPRFPLPPITASPEQLGQRATPASDQYALAVLLYFWLAGRPPFLGTPEEVEQLKLTETISSLTAHNPQVTHEQESILRRALSVYPDERYPSILAFAETLLASLRHTPQQPVSKEVPSPPPLNPTTTPSLEAAPNIENHQSSSSVTPEPSLALFIITSPYTAEPRRVLVEQAETTLGRAGSSMIFLDYDDQTSRHHALLKHEGVHYVIYDRRSISGTAVNGQQITSEGQSLRHGDRVTIGVYELLFQLARPLERS